jgi:hypothetical protein
VKVRKTNDRWKWWTWHKSWHHLYFVVLSKVLSSLSRFLSIKLS